MWLTPAATASFTNATCPRVCVSRFVPSPTRVTSESPSLSVGMAFGRGTVGGLPPGRVLALAAGALGPGGADDGRGDQDAPEHAIAEPAENRLVEQPDVRGPQEQDRHREDHGDLDADREPLPATHDRGRRAARAVGHRLRIRGNRGPSAPFGQASRDYHPGR